METDTAPRFTDEQIAEQEARLRAAGESTETPVQHDYFGFEQTLRVTLPDGLSSVDHKVFTEGQRRKFLNASARDVRVEKITGDAKMKMRPGDERYQLLKTAIVGWNLVSGGSPVPFNDRNLDEFLDKADPRVVDQIEKEVRKANPWLLANLTLEDIDTQIAELTEMRDVKAAEEEAANTFH